MKSISELIDDSEVFIESISMSDYSNKSEKRVHYALGGLIGTNVGLKASVDTSRHGLTDPMFMASAGILAAGVGSISYGIYKYMTSFHRYASAVEKIKLKLKNDPKNPELLSKLNKYTLKMEEARKKAIEEEKSNIEKLKEYKIKLQVMKKQNAPKQEINDLTSKIEVREAALKRAGVNKL